MTKRGFKLALVALVLALTMLFFGRPIMVWMHDAKQPSIEDFPTYQAHYDSAYNSIVATNNDGIDAWEKIKFNGGTFLDIALAREYGISAGFFGFYDAMRVPEFLQLDDSIAHIAQKNAWFDYLHSRIGQAKVDSLLAQQAYYDEKFSRQEKIDLFYGIESLKGDSGIINLKPFQQFNFTYALEFSTDSEPSRTYVYTDTAIYGDYPNSRKAILKAFWPADYPYQDGDLPFGSRVVEW